MANTPITANHTLVDGFGRVIDYLRISVTDRCNLNCIYCRPKEKIPHLTHQDILRYEEILEIVTIARELGIKKFRITGGEPLVRKGLVGFIERLNNMGVNFSLTTNGILLAEYAADLYNAGLKRINISLDTLHKGKFIKITRSGRLQDVLDGIEKAKRYFSPVKINVVLMKGINDNEVDDFVSLALKDGLSVRFIEFMSLFGRKDWFVSLQEIKKQLIQRWNLLPIENQGAGPAKNYAASDKKGTIGFISPCSEPFCSQCNRLRLTPEGKIKSCLVAQSALDIKTVLRTGASPEELITIFREAARIKPQEHNFGFGQINVMSSIGG